MWGIGPRPSIVILEGKESPGGPVLELSLVPLHLSRPGTSCPGPGWAASSGPLASPFGHLAAHLLTGPGFGLCSRPGLDEGSALIELTSSCILSGATCPPRPPWRLAFVLVRTVFTARARAASRVE